MVTNCKILVKDTSSVASYAISNTKPLFLQLVCNQGYHLPSFPVLSGAWSIVEVALRAGNGTQANITVHNWNNAFGLYCASP